MNRILLLLFACLVLINCNDDNCDSELTVFVDDEQLAIDIAAIDAYLEREGLTAIEHPSGIRYIIEREGDGRNPDLCDFVDVTYEGFLLTNDDETFDATAVPRSFDLGGGLINGWKIGIPLVKEGGRILLFIPSVYGYGRTGIGNDIPPNANLIFRVTLFNASK